MGSLKMAFACFLSATILIALTMGNPLDSKPAHGSDIVPVPRIPNSGIESDSNCDQHQKHGTVDKEGPEIQHALVPVDEEKASETAKFENKPLEAIQPINPPNGTESKIRVKRNKRPIRYNRRKPKKFRTNL